MDWPSRRRIASFLGGNLVDSLASSSSRCALALMPRWKSARRELLVGAVQVIVVLAPAQEQGVDPQVLLDQPHDGNRAPLADENRLGAEPGLDGPDRGPETGSFDIDQHGRRAVVGDHLVGHARRTDPRRRAPGTAVRPSWDPGREPAGN